MTSFSLAFLCGILFLLYGFTELPSQKWIIIPLLFSLTIFIFPKKFSRFTMMILGLCIGFSYAIYFSHLTTQWTLPKKSEGKTMMLTGTIASLPETHQNGTSFLFKTKDALLRLTWKTQNQKLHAGEEWQLPVRLKRIHGLMNPGGFDYEAWAFSVGIRASGYVAEGNARKIKQHFSIQTIRQNLYDKILESLPVTNTSHWILALALGERHNIPFDQWQILRNTGTNHLMAIAGLHIGFLSAFIYAMIFVIWRRIPFLVLKIPSQHAASIAALIMAWIYSALAGFSIPTQRACLMFSFFMCAMLWRRKINVWHIYSLALLCVLLFNPLDVLSLSFWLSFGSVALIIYGMQGRLHPKGIWWKHGRIQWVVAVGLIPLSFALFQECSFISFFANSIAIPWVGFFILPLTFIGTFLLLFQLKIGGFFLIMADHSLQYLWMLLTFFSKISWSTWSHAIANPIVFFLSVIGMIILILPKGCKERWLGIILLLPLFFYQPEKPKRGEFWFTLLDVGQGLSAMIETTSHVLIFDAGPRLSENYDMGESVVLPFLRIRGIRKIDMLVVSHGDNDHIGGANAILNALPVNFIKTSVPEKFTKNHADYCLLGEKWQWDGVSFSFLYPAPAQLGLGNDSSCVLKVSNGKQSLLLTGDIEKFAENFLVNNNPHELSADLLVAPHHGSKTSGVKAFIDDVSPHVVLFPIGYRNRYHFPHKKIIANYAEKKIAMVDTMQSGAIQVRVSDHFRLEHFRQTHPHIWSDK